MGRISNHVYISQDIGMLQYKLQPHEKFILSFTDKNKPTLLFTLAKKLLAEIRNEADFGDLIIAFRLKELTKKGIPYFKIIEGKPNKEGRELKRKLLTDLVNKKSNFKNYIENENYKDALGLLKDLDGDYYLDTGKRIFNICKKNLNGIKSDYLWGRKILKLIDEAESLNSYNIYLKRAIKLDMGSLPDYKDYGIFKSLF